LKCGAGEEWRSAWPNEAELSAEKKNNRVKRRKVTWIDPFLRRNCLPKHVVEGKIEGTG
jgi:hypothetical protein